MSNVHKIQVRNRAGSEGKITVGANTEILLDGQKLKGARFLKFEVSAKKVAKVTIEMFAEVEIEANSVELRTTKVKGTRYKTTEGKALAVNTLTNYTPTKIVKEE